jgi:hypothetical protein
MNTPQKLRAAAARARRHAAQLNAQDPAVARLLAYAEELEERAAVLELEQTGGLNGKEWKGPPPLG